MQRRSRRLARLSDDDEFETEILKEFNPAKPKETQPRRVDSDSDDDDNSDLGEEEEVESSDEDKAALSDDDPADEDVPSNAHLTLKDSVCRDDDDDKDDSDEEPESVGFQDSRAAALIQMQQILADMKKEKAKKKTQQQEIEQRNRMQKAKKTKRLKKLATEAESFDDADQLQDKHQAFESEDFIPLSSKKRRKAVVSKQVGMDTVQVLSMSAAGPVKEEVANFRNHMLFGKNFKRVSTQKVIQQRVKRMIIQGKK